jgi:2-methylcitrate dehydratase PrpD
MPFRTCKLARPRKHQIMNSRSHAEQLGAFIAATGFDELPGKIVEKTKRHILDTFGAGLAGSTSDEASRADAMIRATGAAGGDVLWGRVGRVSSRDAAFVNGIAAHSFELDDSGGCDHSGAVVLPAVVAALGLPEEGITGGDLIAAVVLGLDVGRRVMQAFGGYEPHNSAGWHSTGTCGTFGAAAAVAHILKLDAHQCKNAIGIAASFSSGLWAFIHDGSQTKRIHAGRAAEGGLTAALLARQGMTGPARVFDDVWGGFLRAYAHQPTDVEALVRDLGTRWRMEEAVIKPYASCRGTHSAVDAIGRLMVAQHLSADAIAAVRVRMSPFLHGMCGRRYVSSMAAAQMSLPYAVAARMVLGGAGLSSYAAERRGDPRLQAAMDRIELSTDEHMAPSDEPYVTLVTSDGRQSDERVLVALGAPDNPLDDAALLGKFHDLAGLTLSATEASRLADAVLGLDRIADARTLPAMLAPRA